VGILNTGGFNPPESYTIKHFLVPPLGSAEPNGWCRYSTAGGPGLGLDDYSATTLDLNPTLAIWDRSADATLIEGACV
jgi:hypothetical protein